MTATDNRTAPTTASAATPRLKGIVLLLTAGGFASSANLRLMDTVLPEIAREFSVDIPEASSIVAAYALGYGALQLVFGILGDRIGKTRLILIMCLLSAATTGACALAPNLAWLTTARFLAGASAAGITPLALAWIGDNFSMADRRATLASYMTGAILGGVLGQVCGGLLAELASWRLAPATFAVMYLAVAALLHLRTHAMPQPRATSSPIPLPHRIKVMITDLSRPLAMTTLIAVAIEGMAVFGVLAFAGAYLHDRFDAGLGAIGLTLSGFAFGGLFFSTVAIRQIDRIGLRFSLPAAGIMFALGIVGLLSAPTLWLGFAATLMLGIGFYTQHNFLQAQGTQLLPNARGTGMAIFAMAFFAAQSVGVALAAKGIAFFGYVEVFLLGGAAMMSCAIYLSLRHKLFELSDVNDGDRPD